MLGATRRRSIQQITMKKLCYRRADNSIVIGSPSQEIMEIITGAGGLIRPERIDREVAKFLIDVSNETEFQADWVEFLRVRIGSAKEVAARAWVEGLCYGGLTEAAFLARVDAKDRPDDCVGCQIVEDSDLPSDRYFRNAWEWEN